MNPFFYKRFHKYPPGIAYDQKDLIDVNQAEAVGEQVSQRQQQRISFVDQPKIKPDLHRNIKSQLKNHETKR